MDGRYTLEVEPEVESWLAELSPRDYVAVEARADKVAEDPYKLRMPLVRPLGDKVFELRFNLGDNAWRITYWLAPGRRIVMLTVFRRTRNHEDAEVSRAKQAQAVCERTHPPAQDHDVFSRTFKEGELS